MAPQTSYVITYMELWAIWNENGSELNATSVDANRELIKQNLLQLLKLKDVLVIKHKLNSSNDAIEWSLVKHRH